jgi:hypothetical protein
MDQAPLPVGIDNLTPRGIAAATRRPGHDASHIPLRV